ncbi:MAG: 3-isopropylmalate dehydratase small subunit [Deltaproteobacteria bacterium]|nr:3-isopropylmalate dehydratase small subunit [Deltaproteobacteria bacterium]
MIKGRVHKFGDNIDTDAIIPVHAVGYTDPADLGRHCMENIDPDFINRVKAGDVIVGGSNFGCGSSREMAPWAIKGAGIALVIASSFARIFFRNAINIGLPVMISPRASTGFEDGDLIEADPASGSITNLTSGRKFKAAAFPKFIQELIAAGGLVEYTQRRLRGTQGPANRSG